MQSPPVHLRDPSLALKTYPPRVARDLLQRERLSLARLDLAGTQVIAALAPAGFGKTSQLAQWRREALARGALAFWLTLDARDEPIRFVSGLAHAAQQAAGRRGFGATTIEWLERCPDPMEALTVWLAEVARLSVEVLLVLDEVDQAPVSTRSLAISYLLGNAPANLRIALGARPAGALMASGELSRTPHTRVTAADLRFKQQETLSILAGALGSTYDLETALHLHQLTEGWPLGVQLAMAGMRRTNEITGLMAAAAEDLRRYFIDSLINQQSNDASQLLVRIAQFDLIHPDLCVAALGSERARVDIAYLAEQTPLLLQIEGSDWMRLHPLAKDALLERLQQLPVAERQALSRCASLWLAERGMHEAAAEQALLAGDSDLAFDLAERSIRRMVMHGQIGAVLEWHDRMPSADLARHPGFWAPAAWALAMSERHAMAEPLVDAICRRPDATPADLFEADLIRATIAAFSDQAEELAEVVNRWPEPPAQPHPEEIPIYWVSRGFAALYGGHADEARLHWGRIATFDRTQTYTPMTYGFADFGIGLSHLWEGRCALAEQTLRPALARAEERMDRRNLVACMLAAVLAQARWEGGDNEEPSSLLTLRLDVLERQGLPDALLCAYLTLARVAEAEGRQDKAHTLLEALRALGLTRGMLRLQVAAQCELVRQHANEGRAETAHTLSRQLMALVDAERAKIPRTLAPWISLHVELARAHAAIAQPGSDRLTEALQALGAAGSLATNLHLGREGVEVQLMRAHVMRRMGSADAGQLHAEAMSLAQAAGMRRLLERYRESASSQTNAVAAQQAPMNVNTPNVTASVAGGAMLTSKEREVLALLTKNLSNKEIALAMGISEQTIKWHVKNLFTKLGGLNRKHAVARARMLGLIDA